MSDILPRGSSDAYPAEDGRATLAWLVILILALLVIGAVIAALVAVASALAAGFVLAVGVVAGIGAVVGTSATLYFWAHPMLWAVRNRGGDAHPPDIDENAFRQYLAGPVFADFWFSIQQAARGVRDWFVTEVLPFARRFTGSAWTYPVPLGIYLGSPFGIAAALVVLIVLMILGSLVVGVAIVGALATGYLLRGGERLVMRFRGAGHTCPSCHEHCRLPVYRCPQCGAGHRALLPGKFGILRHRCRCDRAELPTLRLIGRANVPAECPHCSVSLHGSIGGLRNVRIPLAGGTAAGKTTLCVGALESLAQLDQAGEVDVKLHGASADAFTSLVSGLGRGEAPGPTSRRAPAVLAEISPGQGRGGLLFAYDVAGELYAQLDELRGQAMLSGFEGALLVLDPFALDGLRTQYPDEVATVEAAVKPTPERADATYQRLVEALREVEAPVDKLPLAVVVTKIDALPESAMLGTDDDARGWLERFGQANLLLTAEQDFGPVRCFATSALGASPGEAGSFSPRGALAPFAWLLMQRGITVPDAPGTAARHVDGEALTAHTTDEQARPLVVAPRDRASYVPTGGKLALPGAALALAAVAGIGFGGYALADSIGQPADRPVPATKSEKGKHGKNGATKTEGKQGKRGNRRRRARGKQSKKGKHRDRGRTGRRGGRGKDGNRQR